MWKKSHKTFVSVALFNFYWKFLIALENISITLKIISVNYLNYLSNLNLGHSNNGQTTRFYCHCLFLIEICIRQRKKKASINLKGICLEPSVLIFPLPNSKWVFHLSSTRFLYLKAMHCLKIWDTWEICISSVKMLKTTILKLGLFSEKSIFWKKLSRNWFPKTIHTCVPLKNLLIT